MFLWPLERKLCTQLWLRSVEPDSHQSPETLFILFFSSLILNASPIWRKTHPPFIFPLNFPHLIPLTWKVGSSDSRHLIWDPSSASISPFLLASGLVVFESSPCLCSVLPRNVPRLHPGTKHFLRAYQHSQPWDNPSDVHCILYPGIFCAAMSCFFERVNLRLSPVMTP